MSKNWRIFHQQYFYHALFFKHSNIPPRAAAAAATVAQTRRIPIPVNISFTV